MKVVGARYEYEVRAAYCTVIYIRCPADRGDLKLWRDL